jgi:glucoamylase
MAWPAQNRQERWLGRNIDVSVSPPTASTKV